MYFEEYLYCFCTLAEQEVCACPCRMTRVLECANGRYHWPSIHAEAGLQDHRKLIWCNQERLPRQPNYLYARVTKKMQFGQLLLRMFIFLWFAQICQSSRKEHIMPNTCVKSSTIRQLWLLQVKQTLLHANNNINIRIYPFFTSCSSYS